MKWTPEQIRNANFAEIKAQIHGDWERVWTSLMLSGPLTTKALAERMEMSLLTVRPRVSDLVDLGFVELVGKDGRDGVYRAVPITEAEPRHEARKRGDLVQPTLF